MNYPSPDEIIQMFTDRVELFIYRNFASSFGVYYQLPFFLWEYYTGMNKESTLLYDERICAEQGRACFIQDMVFIASFHCNNKEIHKQKKTVDTVKVEEFFEQVEFGEVEFGDIGNVGEVEEVEEDDDEMGPFVIYPEMYFDWYKQHVWKT